MQFAEFQKLRSKKAQSRRRWRMVFTLGFWRFAWWSFVKAMWLATLNGVMFIFALREKQPIFAIIIVIFGGVIIYKEIMDVE